MSYVEENVFNNPIIENKYFSFGQTPKVQYVDCTLVRKIPHRGRLYICPSQCWEAGKFFHRLWLPLKEAWLPAPENRFY